MSLQTLEATLGRTAEQIQPRQLYYSSLLEDDGVTPKQLLPHWLIEPIQKDIQDTPELREFATRQIQFGGFGTRLSPYVVAQSISLVTATLQSCSLVRIRPTPNRLLKKLGR